MRPLLRVLRSPRSLPRRARSVRLRVASTLPATLMAGRRRFAVDRRSRTVTVRERPGTRPLALTLRLVAGRLRTSTELVVPRS